MKIKIIWEESDIKSGMTLRTKRLDDEGWFYILIGQCANYWHKPDQYVVIYLDTGWVSKARTKQELACWLNEQEWWEPIPLEEIVMYKQPT